MTVAAFECVARLGAVCANRKRIVSLTIGATAGIHEILASAADNLHCCERNVKLNVIHVRGKQKVFNVNMLAKFRNAEQPETNKDKIMQRFIISLTLGKTVEKGRQKLTQLIMTTTQRI